MKRQSPLSRLFGRAAGLVIDAPDHGDLRSYPRPQNLPDMPNGWLRIRPEQYEGLGSAYQRSMLHRLKTHLAGGKDAPAGRPAQIEAAFRRALGYRVYRFEDLRDFVQADLRFGPEYELQSGREDVRRILTNTNRKATLRVLDAIDLTELGD
jgi:hypothetical protein